MVADSALVLLFWGFLEWFFSLPHFVSVLFVIVGVASLLLGLVSLVRRM